MRPILKWWTNLSKQEKKSLMHHHQIKTITFKQIETLYLERNIMKKLENTIELSKSQLGSQNIATLVKREKDVAIYKRGISIFEVFKVKEQKYSEQVIAGVNVIFEEKELYPNSEQFGTDAYCCSSIEQAEKRFMQLIG